MDLFANSFQNSFPQVYKRSFSQPSRSRSLGGPSSKRKPVNWASTKDVSNIVKSIVKQDVETKLIDTVANASVVTSSGIVVALTNMAQGANGNNRVGDMIKLDCAEMRFNLSAANATDLVRFILVQYFPSAIPVVTTFFQVTGSGGAPLSPFKRDTLEDFSVLFDSGPINLINGTDSQKRAGWLNCIPVKRKESRFNQSATTGSCQLYLVAISDTAAGTNPTISYDIRVMYEDA